MSSPFIGEIRMCPYTFAPRDWASCDGQLIAIAQNDTLFALIGTTYGGDGQNTFALPDLRSRIPVASGNGPGGTYVIGQAAGVEAVTLNINQLPSHSHVPLANSGNGTSATPAAQFWAGSALGAYSTTATPTLQPMSPNAIGATGGSQPHDNVMPYLAVNFIISLFGIFPSRS